MLQFLKFVLATFVGLSLFFMLSLFLLFGIAAVASREQAVTLDQDSILELKLDKPIEERSVENPFANVPLPFGQFQDNPTKVARTNFKNCSIFIRIDLLVQGGKNYWKMLDKQTPFPLKRLFIPPAYKRGSSNR